MALLKHEHFQETASIIARFQRRVFRAARHGEDELATAKNITRCLLLPINYNTEQKIHI